MSCLATHRFVLLLYCQHNDMMKDPCSVGNHITCLTFKQILRHCERGLFLSQIPVQRKLIPFSQQTIRLTPVSNLLFPKPLRSLIHITFHKLLVKRNFLLTVSQFFPVQSREVNSPKSRFKSCNLTAKSRPTNLRFRQLLVCNILCDIKFRIQNGTQVIRGKEINFQ